MTFARIDMLLLLWMIPLLLAVFGYGLRRRRSILRGFSSARGLAATVSGDGENRRRIKAGLMLAAVLFTVLALGGPRYGYRWEEVPRKGVDIVIALDCSRSMLARDIRPSRLDRAKREVADLLGMLQGDRVGLVAFAGTAFLQCPLTVDYETFYLFLDALTPDFLPVGGTDLAGAVATALDAFKAEELSEKAVILITDGQPTGADAVRAAQDAKAAGVKIFCIGVGGPQGVPIPDADGGLKKDASGRIVMTRLDEEMLRRIAGITGGAYVRSVAGDMDLNTIYLEGIREKMDGSTLASRRRQVWHDRYQWFLGVAVLLLALEMVTPSVARNSARLFMVVCLLVLPVSAQGMGFENPFKKGLDAYERGDYDAALKHFLESQVAHPEHPGLFYDIGNAYYRLGDFESALEHYRQAQKSDDRDLRQRAFYNGGNASFRLNRLQEAIDGYRAALEIDPEDRDARLNLEYAKKMLEKQTAASRSPDSEKSGDDRQKSGDGHAEKPPGDSEKAGGQPESDPGETENRKPEADAAGGGSSGREKGGASAAPEDGSAGDSAASAGKSHGDNARTGDMQNPLQDGHQAERILNRLKDMPGKAMIPAYGRQRVEKDW